MGDMTKDFSRSEFACHGTDCCGGKANVRQDLVEALQELRDLVDQPLVISSGYRCPQHNRAIGGAEHSQHCLGTAADIRCPGMAPDDLAAQAEQIERFRAGGIGVYRSWVHVDVRPSGPARWRG